MKQSSRLKLFALIISETTGWTMHLVNMLLLQLAGLMTRFGAEIFEAFLCFSDLEFLWSWERWRDGICKSFCRQVCWCPWKSPFIYGALFLGHLVDSSPALSPEKAESKKSLEMPRLTETSIKDRLAKYQAAVSKQGSSTGLSTTVSPSFGLCRNELLSQPETGKKILWKAGSLKIMPSPFENDFVATGVISSEELPLPTAGRNKYLQLPGIILKVFQGINCWNPSET